MENTDKETKKDIGTVIPESKKGQFDRKESEFKYVVSEKEGAKYPVESGRYHLYCNLPCPFANGALIALHLNGLEDAISFSFTAPEMGVVNQETGRAGWVFDKNKGTPLCESVDTVNGLPDMRAVY